MADQKNVKKLILRLAIYHIKEKFLFPSSFKWCFMTTICNPFLPSFLLGDGPCSSSRIVGRRRTMASCGRSRSNYKFPIPRMTGADSKSYTGLINEQFCLNSPTSRSPTHSLTHLWPQDTHSKGKEDVRVLPLVSEEEGEFHRWHRVDVWPPKNQTGERGSTWTGACNFLSLAPSTSSSSKSSNKVPLEE